MLYGLITNICPGHILWVPRYPLVSPGQHVDGPLSVEPIRRYETVAWIPSVITFIVMLGLGGKHLTEAPTPPPPSAAAVLSFATTTASSVISWCMMTPDYGVYHSSKASR